MNEDIKVDIVKVTGQAERYDAWSVTAEAWVDRGSGREFEKTVCLNVLKDNGNMDEDDDGVPEVVHRIKDTYEDMLLEMDSYTKVSSQVREEEASTAEEMCKGDAYDL